jgi:N4-gp56 family major capsid protein
MADAHLWTDIGAGILANHQISDQILEVALGECKVVQYTHDHGFGFKKNAGETVNLFHVNRLPDAADASLQEEGQIPMRMLSFGKRSLTLTEHGEGLQFSAKLQELSKFKPDPIMRKELASSLERSLDTEAARDGFMSSDVKICFSPTSLTGGVWSVTGAAGAVATSPFTSDHVKKISAYMRDTIHAPFYKGSKGGGEHYVCLSCNTNIENLLLDSNVVKWQQYMREGAMLYKGEMCEVNKIKFVEINRAMAFANLSGTSTVFGEAVIFGDEAVARIEAVTPHLRLNPNFGGRFATMMAMAWWGIYAFGPVWDSASDGKAKMVKLISL